MFPTESENIQSQRIVGIIEKKILLQSIFDQVIIFEQMFKDSVNKEVE